MSAIAGVAHARGGDHRAVLDGMVARIGPRAQGHPRSWLGDRVALVYRPSLAECSVSELPYHYGRWAVTWCGFIDNLRELQSNLDVADDASSGEVLLGAYLRWGHAAPSRVLGDFALAIWDVAERKLFMARDRFGVTPIFYARGAWGIAFASEVDSLLAVPEVVAGPDRDRIAAYVANLPFEPGSTFYRGINAVPPGHTVVLDCHSRRLHKYWTLSANPELELADSREYADEFKRLFVRAVDRCVGPSHATAVLLSGGLDSSSVACTAARMLGSKVHSYTALFPDLPACDEHEYVARVVEAADASATYSDLTDRGGWPAPDVVASRVHDPAILQYYAVTWQQFQAASDHGHRTALTGALGDLVGGGAYNCFRELALHADLAELREEFEDLSTIAFARAAAGVIAEAILPRPFSMLKRAWLRAFARSRNPGLRFLLDPERSVFYSHAVEQSIASYERNSSEDLVARLSGCWPAVELGVVADWCAADHGMAARHPFADAELASWIVRVPLSERRKHGRTRWVARRAMNGVVPDQVRLRRTKTNFNEFYRKVVPLWLEHVPTDAWKAAEDFVDLRVIGKNLNIVARSFDELSALWRCGTLGLWLTRGIGFT